MGLGWGDYFFCKKWFFDFQIGYTFNVFWNQNMFIDNPKIPFSPGPPLSAFAIFFSQPATTKGGDLTLSGLVLKAKVEF